MAKRFYWLKLQKDFFKQHEIRVIEALPNGKDYILFYLKLLVESVSHEGDLRFSDTIPYSEEMLAAITNTNIDVVRSAMALFVELKMIEILDDATIFMKEVTKMIGSEGESAARMRNARAGLKESAQCAHNVQICDKDAAQSGIENRDKRIENRDIYNTPKRKNPKTHNFDERPINFTELEALVNG